MIETRAGETLLRPDVRVVVHGPDQVELRTGVWNSHSTILADDSGQGTLAEIAIGLARGEAPEELARRTGAELGDVEHVVDELRRRGLLATAAAGPLTTTLGRAAEARTIPAESVLLAPPFLAEAFRSMLAASFAGRIEVAADRVLGDLTRDELLLGRDGLETADVVARFAGWRGKLVVVVWPELNPLLLGNVNGLAHAVGFPFLQAAADGPFAVVGPTVVPGETACFGCAETRVLDAMRDHTLYMEYRRALAEGRVHGGGGGAMDPFAALVVSLAAGEATHVLETGTAFTAGKLLTCYAPTMEFAFHELLRLPGCPVCGRRAAADRPLYTDLRSYLAAQ